MKCEREKLPNNNKPFFLKTYLSLKIIVAKRDEQFYYRIPQLGIFFFQICEVKKVAIKTFWLCRMFTPRF
jgi:hypothetical protein